MIFPWYVSGMDGDTQNCCFLLTVMQMCIDPVNKSLRVESISVNTCARLKKGQPANNCTEVKTFVQIAKE